MRTSGRQLKAMLRKNWLLKIRHPFVTCAEIFLPTVVMLMLIAVRTQVDTQIHPAQQYIKKEMFVEVGKGDTSPSFDRVLELLLAKGEFLAFAPDTRETRMMINVLSIKFPLLKLVTRIYNDELELETYIRSDLYGAFDQVKIWWGPNKTRQADSHSKSLEEIKHGCSEDIGSELKELQWAIKPTEPYQMPHLGMSREGEKRKGSTVSAMSILSGSAAYKSLQEKALKRKEIVIENDENENKNSINKIEYRKAVEKSSSHDGGSERLGVALGMAGGMALQRNLYPLTPFLAAPLMTNYNTIDPLTDPILWASLVPSLPTGSSRPAEVTKTEASSDYTFYRPEN